MFSIYFEYICASKLQFLAVFVLLVRILSFWNNKNIFNIMLKRANNSLKVDEGNLFIYFKSFDWRTEVLIAVPGYRTDK